MFYKKEDYVITDHIGSYVDDTFLASRPTFVLIIIETKLAFDSNPLEWVLFCADYNVHSLFQVSRFQDEEGG